MSQGGSESRTVGLPNNSTSPGMGGLGIGGGIYGNPFQVNQMSQPAAMQGGKGGMGQMGQGIGSNTVPEWAKPYIGEVMQKSPLLGQTQNTLMQNSPMPMPSSPMQPPNASMLQGRGAMLNQPQGINSAGLGSLIPGNYVARR